MTTRRHFLIRIGAGVMCAPVASLAQQQKVRRIGLAHVGTDHVPPSLEGLKEGMNALGYRENMHVVYDWRNLPDAKAARAAADAFVRDRVDLIVAFEPQAVRAAMAATAEIPIVMLHVADPVAEGFIKSLAHPGGNITGFAGVNNSPSKELELFKELMPRLTRPLIVFNASDPSSLRWLEELRKAAATLKLKPVERHAGDEADLKRVFNALKLNEVDGVFIVPGQRTVFQSLVLDLADKHGLPVSGQREEFVERGALFSYNTNVRAVGRAAAARYIDRILRGEKPAALPVEQVSQLELIVNRRVAMKHGIAIPPSILVRADRVIE